MTNSPPQPHASQRFAPSPYLQGGGQAARQATRQDPRHIPYAQPGVSNRQPGVLQWFKVYCTCMALLYAGITWMVVQKLTKELYSRSGPDGAIPFIFAAAFLGVFVLLFAAAWILPRERWAWTYSLVLICLGMGGLTLVAAVPLLIFWIKPETKAWFGRRA